MQAASTCVDRSQAHTEISTQGGFEWERNRTESKRANECRFDVFSFGSWDYFWIYAEGKKKDRFSWRSDYYYYHTHFRILCLSTNLYRSLTNSTFHPLFTFGLGFLLKKKNRSCAGPSTYVWTVAWLSCWAEYQNDYDAFKGTISPWYYCFNKPSGPL